ncbi:MAG: hypothetical protein QW379_09695 [Thermoplasmata archaeon]
MVSRALASKLACGLPVGAQFELGSALGGIRGGAEEGGGRGLMDPLPSDAYRLMRVRGNATRTGVNQIRGTCYPISADGGRFPIGTGAVVGR